MGQEDAAAPGLERKYGLGHRHFVTFSCYLRQPFFVEAAAREVFEGSLERMRRRYDFRVDAYVVMPTHVHLLMTEPPMVTPSVALQALKISVARRLKPRPFWQARFHCFNVYSESKQMEKRRYIHRNPVRGGLVKRPEDWRWSSYRNWLLGEEGTVEIESNWTFAKRMREEFLLGLDSPGILETPSILETHISESRCGAPEF